jgi:UDPglucose 6-dehydrogenase
MRVSIIGTGYVGLVTGACLAVKGHHVSCVDIDINKVTRINNSDPPIFEKGLEDLLKLTIQKNLSATTDLYKSVLDSEITLIAVGTPFNGQEIDLIYIKEAARQIGAALKDKQDYHVVVVKSTVVPGTTDEVVLPIVEKSSGKKAGKDFGLGMNPEFLTEGQAIDDFMNPDRIVLGANDDRSMKVLELLYSSFEATPTLKTNCKTAEMIKYASNSMLALQISFANEIGRLCSALGSVDVVDVMRGVHMSNYLSPKTRDGSRIKAPITSFLEAGCGFGGSCLPKDVKALIAHGSKMGVDMSVLKAVVTINESQPIQVINLLRKHFATLENVKISILGLSFKPDTDDMRESPSIPIIKILSNYGAVLKSYDPAAFHEAKKILSDYKVELCTTLEEALAGVQAIILLTKWEEFKTVPELLHRVNPGALFVDGRRMIEKNRIPQYEGIGVSVFPRE